MLPVLLMAFGVVIPCLDCLRSFCLVKLRGFADLAALLLVLVAMMSRDVIVKTIV